MAIRVVSAKYVREDKSRLDVTIEHDGELLDYRGAPMPSRFDYTLDHRDPSPMAQAIKVLIEAQPPVIADYVAPPPPPPLTAEQKLARAALSQEEFDNLVADSLARQKTA